MRIFFKGTTAIKTAIVAEMFVVVPLFIKIKNTHALWAGYFYR